MEVNRTRPPSASPLPCGRVSDPDVCAVVYADAPEVASAVAEQTVRPRVLLTQASTLDRTAPANGESTFVAAVRAARRAGCRWIWLLDGRASPDRRALEALLAGYSVATAPPPALLASKIVDPQGALHPGGLPRHEVFEKQHSVDAAERNMVQLRSAAHGSVLVAAAAIDQFGLPRSDLAAGIDMQEWSARILRSWDVTGYLVTASVAVRARPPEAVSWRQWIGRTRLLASRAWTPSEKLWEMFVLGRDVGAALRGRGTDQGRRGVGAPGLSPSRIPRSTTISTGGAKRFARR